MKNPQIGIGVIIQKEDMILLGRRTAGHGKGTWQSTGGHLEFGETPEQAALREVKEEVGIEISNLRFLTITNDVFLKENKHYITIFYIGDYKKGDLRVLEPTKCSEWKWFLKDKLPSNLFLPYEKVLKKNN